MTKSSRGEITPKSVAANRDVDVPDCLAKPFSNFMAVKSGYLFTGRAGRPKIQRNVLRSLQDRIATSGLHSFRRFRTEVLRRAGTPEDLISMWTGHAIRNLNDLYSLGLRFDVVRRREWCERVGLGFELPPSFFAELGDNGRQARLLQNPYALPTAVGV